MSCRHVTRYTHDWDVENPMFVPNLSGQLKHHPRPCTECEGTGYYDEEEEDPCSYCEEGEVWWVSWYGADRGRCAQCGAENALVADVYETHGSDVDACWCCLPCYVRHHKEECGCALWKDAEQKLVLFMPRKETKCPG